MLWLILSIIGFGTWMGRKGIVLGSIAGVAVGILCGMFMPDKVISETRYNIVHVTKYNAAGNIPMEFSITFDKGDDTQDVKTFDSSIIPIVPSPNGYDQLVKGWKMSNNTLFSIPVPYHAYRIEYSPSWKKFYKERQ